MLHVGTLKRKRALNCDVEADLLEVEQDRTSSSSEESGKSVRSDLSKNTPGCHRPCELQRCGMRVPDTMRGLEECSAGHSTLQIAQLWRLCAQPEQKREPRVENDRTAEQLVRTVAALERTLGVCHLAWRSAHDKSNFRSPHRLEVVDTLQ